MQLVLLLLAICPVLALAQPASILAPYDQPYRPQYHFSPRENWTNDPNGLVYFEGEYHLFFQYNPFGDEWGHMTWGHAVSQDLVHWEQLPPAIPEENGIMIFTGSTVVDEHNTSGFCTNHKPCLVAIYTGHTPKNSGHAALQTQNLAFSNDRGRTWTKYSGNPVLDLHLLDFRDPKVFWSPQAARWVMVVSLPNDHKVRIYGSADLKHWSALSEFGPAGATGGQWECPELFELPIEGRPGETRWLLKVGLNPGALQGGSGEQYFVGRFDGTRFINDNPVSETMWTDYGKDCYCALTFNNLPPGRPPVMIGWMNNWQYAKDLPTSPWRGQLTFPRSLRLRQTPEGLRLVQMPVDQLRQLEQKESEIGKTGTIEVVNRWLAANSALTKGRTFQLKTEISLGSAQEVGWRILEGNGNYTILGYDRKARKLFFDRTHSGLINISKNFPLRTEATLVLQKAVLRLNVLVDRNSVEIFADEGRLAATNLVFPPAGANGIEVYPKGGHAGEISADITPIQSIWAGADEPAKPFSRAEAAGIIANARKIVTPNGVERLEKVRIGGIEQWVSIRGADRRNPILLYIHGGPGYVSMPMSWWFARGWEEYFTVVQWDQRAAGKTHLLIDPARIAPTLTRERMIADTEEMAAWIRREFGKTKIFVLGHSWGSFLGLQMARRHPAWLHAYIGVGQLIDGPESERRGWRFAIDAARRAGNAQAIHELEAIRPYAARGHIVPIKDLYVQRKWVGFYGGVMANRRDNSADSALALLSPDYNDEEISRIWEGNSFATPRLLAELLGLDLTNIRKLVVPLILFEGRHDRNVNAEVAANWFDKVEAPEKHLVWFEHSGHMPMTEEPGKFFLSLVRIARPIAEKAGDTAP